MNVYRCLVIEDDSLAIDMMKDYIGRRKDLLLAGVVQELSDIGDAMSVTKPDIVFLDLVIPSGAASGFHFGLLPTSVIVVVVSATATDYFKGRLPQKIAYELLKPVSFEDFDHCIDLITEQLSLRKRDH